jgi:transcription-repair coupling factor (superfamily II helicase)
VTSQRELAQIRDELVDRFGPIPDEVEHLLALIALRLRSAEVGIESIVEREREIVVRPVDTNTIDRRRLTSKLGQAVRFTPSSIRLRLSELEIPWQEAVDAIIDVVDAAT